MIFYRYDGDEWIEQQKIPSAHDDTVWNAKFDLSGNYLVSVGADSKLKLWKKALGETIENTKWNCIVSIDVPQSKWPIYTVSWDHYSDVFAIGGGDRTLW
jgi:WD40 repeat protein